MEKVCPRNIKVRSTFVFLGLVGCRGHFLVDVHILLVSITFVIDTHTHSLCPFSWPSHPHGDPLYPLVAIGSLINRAAGPSPGCCQMWLRRRNFKRNISLIISWKYLGLMLPKWASVDRDAEFSELFQCFYFFPCSVNEVCGGRSTALANSPARRFLQKNVFVKVLVEMKQVHGSQDEDRNLTFLHHRTAWCVYIHIQSVLQSCVLLKIRQFIKLYLLRILWIEGFCKTVPEVQHPLFNVWRSAETHTRKKVHRFP